MEEIRIFNNPDFGDVRTIVIDGEPWFVGNDCAKALGYKNLYNGVNKNVDDEDRRVSPVESASGIQQTTIINESGLYSLIFGSKLDSAKKFKRWVTSEVLPSLRKTGTYGAPKTIPEQIQLLAQGNVELNQRVDTLTERMDKIEMDLPVLPLEADQITEAVRRKGVSVLGGKGSPAYNNRSIRQRVYMDIYGELKRQFSVNTYKSLQRKNVQKAIDTINEYKAPLFLDEAIGKINF